MEGGDGVLCPQKGLWPGIAQSAKLIPRDGEFPSMAATGASNGRDRGTTT